MTMSMRFNLYQQVWMAEYGDKPTITPFVVLGIAMNKNQEVFYTDGVVFSGVTNTPRWVASRLLFATLEEAVTDLNATADRHADAFKDKVWEARRKAEEIPADIRGQAEALR